MQLEIDLTDIPAVPADDLWRMIEVLITGGFIESYPRLLTSSEVDVLEREFWMRHRGTGNQALAISHRFRALTRVMAARRLAPLLGASNWRVLAASVEMAATMRLNPKWGFKTLTFRAALEARLKVAGRAEQREAMRAKHRSAPVVNQSPAVPDRQCRQVA